MTDLKRFTISINKETEVRLNKLKQFKYYNTTRNKMIQDLIVMGLDAMEKKMEKKKKGEEDF